MENNCHLLIRMKNSGYLQIWRNFLYAQWVEDSFGSVYDVLRIWKGAVVNDVIVFETEQDKMWFVLNWS
jgi:hypothetical protein